MAGWQQNEDHPELIVEDHGVTLVQRSVRDTPLGDLLADACVAIHGQPFASKHIEGSMLRNLHQPGGWIPRNPVVRPASERREQRLLHHILDEIDTRRAQDAREGRCHPSGFMPKEVVDEGGN